MDNAAFQNTDDAPAIAVLAAVRHCANSWEGSARLLGNVRASDIARACSEAIARIEVLEAALRQIEALGQTIVPASDRLAIARSIARAALAPEQDK